MARALQAPVACLLTDEFVLSEIRVSDETLGMVKRDGWPAANAAAERLSGNVAALLMAEASRPPVDLSPGARPKRRRSREEILVGIAGAKASREARRKAAREARRIASPGEGDRPAGVVVVLRARASFTKQGERAANPWS
jgi:hypothetical protein